MDTFRNSNGLYSFQMVERYDKLRTCINFALILHSAKLRYDFVQSSFETRKLRFSVQIYESCLEFFSALAYFLKIRLNFSSYNFHKFIYLKTFAKNVAII